MLLTENQAAPVTRLLRSRRCQFWNLEMIQIFADKIVGLFDVLRALQKEVSNHNAMTPDSMPGIVRLIGDAERMCEDLGFVSGRKQTERIRRRGQDGQQYPIRDFCEDLDQLCTRIREDMEECVFYSESDPAIVSRFFTKEMEIYPETGTYDWRFKSPEELFDKTIVERFEATADDISEACYCYLFGRNRASVFHSMRVVEIGLLHVARLAGIEDPKPSWGRVLKELERCALHTKYEDLPDKVKPHRERIRTILPRMQAVQHAWRNKFDHATLTPTQAFSPTEAKDILEATEGFMRTLAQELPDRPVTAS